MQENNAKPRVYMSWRLCWRNFIEMDEGFLLVADSCQYGRVSLRYSIVSITVDDISQMLSI